MRTATMIAGAVVLVVLASATSHAQNAASSGLASVLVLQDPASDVCSLLAGANVSAAQRAAKGSSSAESGYDVLFKLTGRWRVAEEYPKTPDTPNGASGKGDAAYRKSLDNFFVMGDYKSKCKELDFDVKGHAVFTYDEVDDVYRYWWFDNYGATTEYIGEYVDRSNSLIFKHTYQDEGGQTLENKQTFRFMPDGTMVATMEMGTGQGKFDKVLTAKYEPRDKKDDERDPARKTKREKPRGAM